MTTPFVLAAGRNETLIVNRIDLGVGAVFLARGGFDTEERDLICGLLTKRREEYGDGVVVFDCGANIGSHTVAWAKHMIGWGLVVAIEAQEWTFYALAGNIALNNCFNARAIWAAVAAQPGMMQIPTLDYNKHGHFSGLHLRKEHCTGDHVGQTVDYNNLVAVQAVSVDGFKTPRLDFLKIDVEGMDLEVLAGAEQTIEKNRPLIYVEVLQHKDEICAWLSERGYNLTKVTHNILATHKSDISYDV